jgi:LysM repeat protein
VNRVCHLLGLTGDRRSAMDGIDAAHRCHSDAVPLPIERQWQARFCLTPAHPQCERYQQAMARRGTAVLGRAPIADGLVSTRMILAPEPPWRGMAGRARRAGPGRVVALGAVATVLGAGAIAAIAAADGGLDLGALSIQTSPSPNPTPSPTPTPTPPPATPSPTPLPTATPPPAEAPPPATVAPTPAPTPRTYVVQQGDTLGSIAQQFGTTSEAIQAANGIQDPNVITVGQVLVIP